MNGKYFKLWRESQELKQSTVAHKIGMPISTLQTYEAGKCGAYKHLRKLSEISGIPMEELWNKPEKE